MRLFVAVELPAEVRNAIAAGTAALRRELPPARWVRPEGIHITLKFLGEHPEALVRRLDEAVGPALAGESPVLVAPGGGGFFPHERRPRVAWVGGEAAGLVSWAEAVDEACTGLGVPRETRPFALHLTLARLERPWPAAAVARFTEEAAAWKMPAFVAREAVLFRSELRPQGAVYTALHRWPVGKGETDVP